MGLGAVLIQEKNGQRRAVCYASRTLSNVERQYSQTEREALALVWACKRFHLYVYGLPKFDLVTDHEALKVIYSRKSKPSARIEHWVLCLQPYNYQVCYVSLRKNIADALSRLTKIVASSQSQDNDEYVRMVALHAAPVALKIKEIERVSAEDPELQAVRRCLVEERWNSAPKQFLPVRNELTFIGHVSLRGTRIVMPQALRKRIVSLAHEGHQDKDKGETQDESLVAGDGSGCGEAMCGVLWVPTCDQTCSAPTGETQSYASATMGRFSSGYIGSTSVRRESVSLGGLSQQVDRS